MSFGQGNFDSLDAESCEPIEASACNGDIALDGELPLPSLHQKSGFGTLQTSNETNDSFSSNRLVSSGAVAPSLVISESAPDRASSADSELANVFDFKLEHLQKSLRIITGPKTDMISFKNLLRGGFSGLSVQGNFVFYKRNGLEISCTIRGIPASVDGSNGVQLFFDVESGKEDSAGSQSFNYDSKTRSALVIRNSGPVSSSTELDSAVMIHVQAVKQAGLAVRFGKTSLSAALTSNLMSSHQ